MLKTVSKGQFGIFQGIIEIQGTFNELASSSSLYAKLLTEEPPEPPAEEEKTKVDGVKITRQMSTRVGYFMTRKL